MDFRSSLFDKKEKDKERNAPIKLDGAQNPFKSDIPSRAMQSKGCIFVYPCSAKY